MQTDHLVRSVGEPAPTEPNSFRGSPTLLAFFPSDWDPAREHQLEILRSNLRLLSEPIDIIDLDTDRRGLDADVEGEEPVHVSILENLDPYGGLAKAYGVEGKSAMVVLDGEGAVQFLSTGPLGSFPGSEDLVRALDSARQSGLSRRQFVAAAVATLAALLLLPTVRADNLTHATRQAGGATYTLHVNGQNHRIPADARITVLDALRERLGLTGTKKGCDHGQCGACTIHLNGRRVKSCLLLAAQAEGAQITTVEGLAHGEELHPVQQAFIEHDGFQCGYCTPGQIMSAAACIKEGHTKSREEIREWMSGNICRCGAYQGILEAIQSAAKTMGGSA